MKMAWLRHDMNTLFLIPAAFVDIPAVIGGFTAQISVMLSFDSSLDLLLA